MCKQFVAVRAFRAKSSARNWRFRIAFDRNQLPIFMKHKLAATDCAVGTYGSRNLCAFVFRTEVFCEIAHGFRASAVATLEDLPENWPLESKFFKHSRLPPRRLGRR